MLRSHCTWIIRVLTCAHENRLALQHHGVTFRLQSNIARL